MRPATGVLALSNSGRTRQTTSSHFELSGRPISQGCGSVQPLLAFRSGLQSKIAANPTSVNLCSTRIRSRNHTESAWYHSSTCAAIRGLIPKGPVRAPPPVVCSSASLCPCQDSHAACSRRYSRSGRSPVSSLIVPARDRGLVETARVLSMPASGGWASLS